MFATICSYLPIYSIKTSIETKKKNFSPAQFNDASINFILGSKNLYILTLRSIYNCQHARLERHFIFL